MTLSKQSLLTLVLPTPLALWLWWQRAPCQQEEVVPFQHGHLLKVIVLCDTVYAFGRIYLLYDIIQNRRDRLQLGIELFWGMYIVAKIPLVLHGEAILDVVVRNLCPHVPHACFRIDLDLDYNAPTCVVFCATRAVPPLSTSKWIFMQGVPQLGQRYAPASVPVLGGS